MAAVKVDLHIEQGADWPGLAIPMLDADNTPYSLSGCTARGQIRTEIGATEAAFTWSTSPAAGEGLIVLSGNLVTFSVTAEQSSAWEFDRAFYDIELTNPSAPAGQRVIRVASGRVIVDLEVTR